MLDWRIAFLAYYLYLMNCWCGAVVLGLFEVVFGFICLLCFHLTDVCLCLWLAFMLIDLLAWC